MDGHEREEGHALRVVAAGCITWGTAAAVHARLWSRAPEGWPAFAQSGLFATSLLVILAAHEFGHRRAAARHGIVVTLPMFLPFPVLWGTFGALIGLRTTPRDRDGLLEMAVAGPLTGLVMAALILIVRWLLGAPPRVGWPAVDLALPPAWWCAAQFGLAPAHVDPSDPLAFAVWIGVWMTGVNLLPLGQLDGGHIFGAMFPAWRGVANRLVTGGLVAAGFAWPGWWLWLFALVLIGGFSPLSPAQTYPLTVRSYGLGVLAALICLGTFSAVPFH